MNRIDQLKQLLVSSPDDPFLNHALALEYIKLGDEAAARGLFEKLLSANPDYVGSYYQLAKLYERNGENDKAILTYEKGIAEAQKAGDALSLREMKAALDELLFE